MRTVGFLPFSLGVLMIALMIEEIIAGYDLPFLVIIIAVLICWAGFAVIKDLAAASGGPDKAATSSRDA